LYKLHESYGIILAGDLAGEHPSNAPLVALTFKSPDLVTLSGVFVWVLVLRVD